MVCLDLDHPDIEAFIDWKVTEERKVAMLAAGSLVLNRHWNALCEAVEGSTTRDASPKTNEKLRKALARAKAEGVAPAFLSQSLSRLSQGDFARDLKQYDTTWDGDGYVTVGGMNSNNSDPGAGHPSCAPWRRTGTGTWSGAPTASCTRP